MRRGNLARDYRNAMDIEGNIQFIINQEAQFVADIHSLQESQRQLGIKVDKLTLDVDKLHEIVKQHEDSHIVTAGMVSKLGSMMKISRSAKAGSSMDTSCLQRLRRAGKTRLGC